ncbi:terminase family protein [Clostridium sp. FP2]|uniref:terminase large subunit domain-containing protein n=1 Tax=Clostridium sp. FP2 TaxID=2724481 RepID=UPI0013E9557E|nr:terminase family protein [Clostridium sp. FP2]MBZ9622859.1 terminase family protein [Clostridium sp. FP2]
MATNPNYSHKKQASQSGTQLDLGNPDSHKVVRKNGIDNAEEWEKQILFWRSHLDIFIHDYFPYEERKLELFDYQQIIARNCGNSTNVKDIEARSLGKTWKMGLILPSIAILYSETPILVVSKTVKQACLTLKYIKTLAALYPNFQRELKSPVRITKDGGFVEFKNGSTIEALAMNTDGSNLRGLRKKVILIDESAWVKSEVIKDVLVPILSFKRDIWWAKRDEGFEDFESKLFETSSAYLKSCDFFLRFKDTLTAMKKGDTTQFASALSYKVAVRNGVKTEEEIETYKNGMVLSSFEMEWGSKFIGSENGSFLPYDLTEPCRDFDGVELFQPKGSKSRYILSLDVATSAAKTADNAALTITKISERTDSSGKLDGTFNKYLVYIRTFHGYGQEALAIEIRKMCIRFPNIERVIVDGNAIGEGVVGMLNFPYVSEGEEYKPFVRDDIGYTGNTAIPIVRSFIGNNKLNNRAVTKTRLYCENRSLHLPIQSASVSREQEEIVEFDEDSGKKSKSKVSRDILIEEVSIYRETDALQSECSTIVPKISASGNTIYDTALTTQHKDRYSSLIMAMEYISELEDENRERYNNNTEGMCMGIAMTWN